MMQLRLTIFILILPILGFTQETAVAEQALATAIPQWVIDHWAAHTAGDGVWQADNSAHKNEQEPFDAYGMKWEWGIGKKSLKGRLYCIQEGKDVGTVWEFLNYWDPNTQNHRMVQLGSDGTLGQGEITLQEDGTTRSAEQFKSPAGGGFEVGHHIWFEAGEMYTQSYNIAEGEWTKRRLYIWKQP
jgi:hypothetical protein